METKSSLLLMDTTTTAPAAPTRFIIETRMGNGGWIWVYGYKAKTTAIKRMSTYADGTPGADWRVRSGEGETFDIHAVRGRVAPVR